MAYRKFCRTLFTDKSETLLSFLDLLDAVQSDAVDSFESIVRVRKAGKCYVRQNELEVGQNVHYRSDDNQICFLVLGMEKSYSMKMRSD